MEIVPWARRAPAAAMASVVALIACVACSSSPPDPGSDEVQEARVEATAQVDALGPDAWGMETPLVQASQDICQEGQQNWKVKEVSFTCTAGTSWVVSAAAGKAQVEEALDAVTDRAAALQCEPVGTSDLSKARRYWVEGIQPEAGSLPAARYTCGDATVELQTLSATESRISPIDVLVGDLTGETVGSPTVENFPADASAQVEASGAAMLWQLTVTQEYAVQQ